MKQHSLWVTVLLATAFLIALGMGHIQAQETVPQDGVSIQVAERTDFTYQGRLTRDGHPVNGTCDFQFTLWDAATGGHRIGSPQTKAGVRVTNGLFNVQLDFGRNAFQGEARWLQVAVRCPTSRGSYTTLTPRQPVTSVPYAMYALSAPWSGLTGVPAGFADGVDNDTQYRAGTGLTLVGNEFRLRTAYRLPQGCNNGQVPKWNGHAWQCGNDETGSGAYWSLTGNAGTNPERHFLGTTDDQPLHIAVNGHRVMRLEPGEDSPNVIGGHEANLALHLETEMGPQDPEGVFIGGGGTADKPNKASDSFTVICGGAGNAVGGFEGAVIDHYGTVCGGRNNWEAGLYGTIGGGENNRIFPYLAQHNTIGGGWNNRIDLTGGGTIGGGINNKITAGNYGRGAVIGGGEENTANEGYTTVGGGYKNTASGPNATVGGGYHNTARGENATVSGGRDNTASSLFATVGGGGNNVARGTHATVSGGMSNAANAIATTVSGGTNNTAGGTNATVGGGTHNTASGTNAVVGGGTYNTASGASATVSGGHRNRSTGGYATVPGGANNQASGNYSFAAGRRAKATHNGAFVWADSTNADFSSDRADQFKVRARGGVHFTVSSSGLNPPGVKIEQTSNAGVGLFIIQRSSDAGLVITNKGSGDLIKAFSSASGGNLRFRVSNSGEVYADGHFHSGGADFAEMMPAGEPLEPGDVLVVGADGKLHRSRHAYDTRVVGVYSTRPGFVGGQGATLADDERIPLAVVGVVPVKASAENGPIHPGDLLVSAQTPGHAMKAGATPPVGTVIGKALQGLEEGTGTILMLVMLR